MTAPTHAFPVALAKVLSASFSAAVFRQGIDIEAPIGEVIKAVEKGRVVIRGSLVGYGTMRVTDHVQRYFSIYADPAEKAQKYCSLVEQEEGPGLVGDSRAAAGTRLYFKMRKMADQSIHCHGFASNRYFETFGIE